VILTHAAACMLVALAARQTAVLAGSRMTSKQLLALPAGLPACVREQHGLLLGGAMIRQSHHDGFGGDTAVSAPPCAQ
jgi:hypothetical protein